MRLKQLLGVLFLLLILSAMSAAAVSQLTKVSVAGQEHATTVTLHASGAFTHTEYRPADNLLLVDLTGVNPGKLKDTSQAVNRHGLVSYQVVGYQGASGREVTRVAMSLLPGAVVKVAESAGALQIEIAADAKASVPAPAASAPLADKPAPPVAAKTAKPVLVQHVSVVRGKGGMEVEISSSGPITPKVMKLTAPDRVVLDLPNALPAGRLRPITVNGTDIKAVRLARYQLDPPVTRVVIDLVAPRDYEVLPSARKLVLKLHAAQPQVAVAAPVAPAPAVPAPAPAAPPAQVQAAPVVMVEPAFTAKPAAPEPSPRAQAETAARTIQTQNRADALLPAPSATLAGPAVNLAAEQQQTTQRMAGQPAPSATPHYTGEPISVNLKDVDLKDFFRLIHEISGLNIVLDPAVKGSLTLVLDDVPWDQALDIVLQNNGLDRRLEGNVLRIATRDTFTKEADARRAQDEALALSVPKVQFTHFLSYAHATEVLPIIKKFLSQRGDVTADPRTNALIITDIPSVLPDVQRVIAQLDRKTQEVEIEARVVAATRNFARDIGVQLAFGWGGTTSAVGGAPILGNSPLLVNIPGAKFFNTAGAIPLFSNLGATGGPGNPLTGGIGFSNATKDYRIDAILTMAEAKGLLKILSRPRIVTQNNIAASVKQGVRIPTVTAAQLGGPPTTTYIEAALRLQVTPQITVENTIFLNVDVENTTPNFSQQVGGNPTLVTQQATTQVLVTDGGTVVIGGVIQTQNSVAINQIPLLGDIPVLGNLFKHRAVQTQTQELIFFITPRIVQT
jgi:type IV pilus assembly protein PilQ